MSAENEPPHDCFYPKAQAKWFKCKSCFHRKSCSKKRFLPMPKYRFNWTKEGIVDNGE